MIFINTASDTTGLFKPFFPITIPYGIGYLMAVLRAENLYFSFVDQQTSKNVLRDVQKKTLLHEKPYIFAISTLTESFSSARLICDKLKNIYPDSVIIMGGLHPSAMPVEVLKSVDTCDYVFIGEAETQISNIYRLLKSGNDLKTVTGIAYRDGDIIINNPESELVIDLDSLPPFPYDLFLANKRYNMGHIISSRGCPYNCTFCCVKTIGKRKYRFRSTASVIDELELIVTKYNHKHIAFFDDNFITNEARVFDLCKRIRNSKYLKGVTYSFQARTKNMKKEVLEEMYNSGFNTVFFGIETVSDELLRSIGKDETISEIEIAIKLAQEIGYKVMANFLFCLPGETKHIRTQCVDFAIRNKLALAKFNNVVPYPGTAMFEQLNKDNKLFIVNDYKNFNSQEVLVRPAWKKTRFPYIPDGESSLSVKQDILFAYFRFYFRLNMLRRVVTDKNWGDAIFTPGNKTTETIKKIPAFFVLMFDMFFKFGSMFLSVFSSKGIGGKDLLKCLKNFYK